MNETTTTEQQHPASRKRWIWYGVLLMIPLVLLAMVMPFVMNYRTIQHLNSLGDVDRYGSIDPAWVPVHTEPGWLLNRLSTDWQKWLAVKLGDKYYAALQNITWVDLRLIDKSSNRYNFFHNNKIAVLNPKVTDKELSYLVGLTHLRVLYLDGTNISDAGLRHLKGLHQLEILTLEKTPISDAGLVHIKGLSQLGCLGLENTKVTDAGLIHLKEFNKLSCLDLTGTVVTDAGLAHLAGLSKFTDLDLEETKITDAGMVHLKGLVNLYNLSLENTIVTDGGLPYLSGLTKLEFLGLGTQVTSAGVEKLKSALPHCAISRQSWLQNAIGNQWSPEFQKMKIVDFAKAKKEQDSYWKVYAPLTALKLLKWTEELSLKGVDFDDNEMVHLRSLTQLKKLNLDNTPVTDAGLKHLKGLKNLKKLRLGIYVSIEGVEQIQAALPQCEVIRETWAEKIFGHMGHAQPDNNQLSYLQNKFTPGIHLIYLDYLNHSNRLGDLEYLNLSYTEPSDEVLAYLDKMTNLRYLNLTNIELLPEDVVHFKKMTDLETLIINGYCFEDDDQVQIKDLTKLKRLNLAGSYIYDEGLKHIQGLTNLTYLNLTANINANDTQLNLNYLKDFTKLRYLNISGHSSEEEIIHLKGLNDLETLILSSTFVSDDDLSHILKLKKLKHLNLDSTSVTFQGLKRLEELPELKILTINNANISRREVQQLQTMMPHCFIRWKQYE